jgi:hypothetical protein
LLQLVSRPQDRLVQATFAEHLAQELGWETIYAWNQKTTELYAGHLDTSTAKQTEYLGNFWSGELAEAAGS